MTKTSEILKDLISYPSFTPTDESPKKEKEKFKACEDCLNYIRKRFKDIGAQTRFFTFEGGHEKKEANYPVPNLLSKIEFGDPSAEDRKTICYIGHIDVVKVEDESLWRHHPFAAAEEDGFIYGRGATDMKGSVAAFINAMEEMHKNQQAQNLTVYSIITGDEEWYAYNGTDKVLAKMKEEGINPDVFLVGEPSSPDYLGTHIKLGRRGSLNGSIEVKGISGHVAYSDDKINPNLPLNVAMSVLNNHVWNDGNDFFPSTNFEISNIQSGKIGAGTNVTPEFAMAEYNIRFHPSQNPEGLLRQLKHAVLNASDEIKKSRGYEYLHDNLDSILKARIEGASFGYISKPADLTAAALKSIKEEQGIITQLDGSGGSTDGRFVHKYFPNAEVIEVGDVEKGGIINGIKSINYGFEGGIHQVNERASVENLDKLSSIYQKTFINYANGKDR